ncbi:MAG: glycosyltransferase family 9 protein [Flavobacteriaceae bacterium]|nr:glycosyltransferase family 9 protein [Flavobacteriaceae bacterium]
MNKPVKHILVIRLSALGDVAMLIPVLRSAINAHPHLRFTVLTRPFYQPLFEGLNNVSVYPTDLKGRHQGLLGLWRLTREIKKINPDAIADCHNVLRTNIIKLFSSIQVFTQIDKGRSDKRDLVSGKRFEQLKTTHQRYADVFRSLGIKVNLENAETHPKPQLTASLKSLLGDYRSLVGIAPYAAHQAKCYPLINIEEIIKVLTADHTIILFGGGQEETKALQKLADRYDRVINMAGKVSFKEELDVIGNLDLMIAMDSGNGHLAAAYGVQTISVWGVTHPYAGFAPFNQDPENAILPDRTKFPLIPTSIYGNKVPKGYEDAIASIKPEEIISRAVKVLRDQTSS